MHTEAKLDKAFRTAKIIAAALAASVLLYAVVVEVLKFREITLNLLPAPLLEKLRFIFVFLAFADYFIIGFVNKKILVKKPGDSHEALLGKLTLANLVALALCELPAFFGLILFLGSGDSRDFYPLLVISLLLFYAFFPKYGFWSNWSRLSDPRASS